MKSYQRRERRSRTLRVSVRRHKERQRVLRSTKSIQPFYFAKKSSLGCRDRKRHPGAPRIGVAGCKYSNRARIYQWRNDARELERLLLLQRVDSNSDEISLLSTQMYYF